MGRGELFSDTIIALLDIASQATSENRIHALNILRNLYRESRLNQVIGPYIARGLMLSITGFEAADWPVYFSSSNSFYLIGFNYFILNSGTEFIYTTIQYFDDTNIWRSKIKKRFPKEKFSDRPCFLPVVSNTLSVSFGAPTIHCCRYHKWGNPFTSFLIPHVGFVGKTSSTNLRFI